MTNRHAQSVPARRGRRRTARTVLLVVASLLTSLCAAVLYAPAADAADRMAVTSYDRMAPGAPHAGFFNSAWQSFVAQSDTVTSLAATVGTPNYSPDGHALSIKLCTDPTCSTALASAAPTIVNYGRTQVDIGDIAVTVGTLYYVVWYQPAAWNGQTWNTYWWSGGSSITTADQMQAQVLGYNRQPPVDRVAITSYDQIRGGAPHNGYFDSAYQSITASSNTITTLGVTVGNVGSNYSGSNTVRIRLCLDTNCNTALGETNPVIVNYGDTEGDIGDVSVTPGQTYYIVYYQPAAWNGHTWITYWWGGGSTIASSDVMQVKVRGYNRSAPVIPTFHVHGTGGVGLKQRTGPGLQYSYNGVLLEGATIQVACQTATGSVVGGSDIWDQLTNGLFVSDFYTDTPVYNGFSPGIDQCGGTPAPPTVASTSYQITATAGLKQRTGPSTAFPAVGALPYNASAPIVCQWRSDSSQNGSTIWDQISDGTWLADGWLNTPGKNAFTSGIPQCVSAPTAPTYEYPVRQSYGRAGRTAYGTNPTSVSADPVNTLTGAYWTQDTDLKLASVGVPFELDRSYTSANQAVGPLGQGWTDNFATHLTFGDLGDVTAITDQGSSLAFQLEPTGLFVGAAGIDAQLSKLAGGYELVRRDQTHLLFDAAGNEIAILGRNGQGLQLTNDAAGRVTSVLASGGRTVTFAYDPTSHLLTSVTLPDGRSTQYGYTNGLLTSVTDPTGAVTTYQYDGSGRLTACLDANGHTRVQNTYGSDGRVTSQTDPLGNVSTFSWDVATETATTIDDRGNTWKDGYTNNVLTSRVDPLGRTTTYTYDGDLNLIAVTDPRGNDTGATAANFTTSYTYDQAGNRTGETEPAPLGHTKSWTYDSFHNVTSATDGRGNTTTNTYDAAGNLIQTTQPGNIVTKYGRDPAGTGLLVSQTDPNGHVTHYGYDAAGNQTSVTTPLGGTTTMTYDSAGRMTSRVDPRGNVSGASPAAYRTTFAYDGDDRLTKTTDPLGHATSTTYDAVGSKKSLTDANGHVTSWSYDAADHLSRVTAPTGGHTDYTYDPTGNLITRTDANGHVTHYAFDAANQLSTVTDPLGRTTNYTYDLAGNPATKTDGRGLTTTYTYDALNRLTHTTYPQASGTYVFPVTLSYDANGNRVGMSLDGAGSTTTSTYDALNRLTTVTGYTGAFTYKYDADGHVTSRTYPDGTVTKYTYNADGRMHSVTANGGTTTYGYDAAGNQTSKTLPSSNGYVERWRYDAAGRVSQVSTSNSSSTLTTYTYTRDPVGNPSKVVGTDGTALYTYDAQDRLTQACYGACGTSSISYTYDPVGNRKTQVRSSGTTTTHTYDDADELKTSTTSGSVTNYAYDGAGNQTTAGATTFKYDGAGKLAEIDSGATQTTLFYLNGDDNRTNQSIDNTSTGKFVNTNYAWDTNNTLPMLALETTNNNVLLRRYAYGNELIAMTSPSGTFYLTGDALGSVTGVTSSTGTALLRYSYDPYGVARAMTKLATTGLPSSEPLRFDGQYADTFGGYDLRAREYNASAGEFGQVDPVTQSPSNAAISPYLYSSDAPTTLSDPSGQCPWCVAALIGAVVGAVVGAVGYYATCTAEGGGCSWEGAAISAGCGAVAGAITVATAAVTFSPIGVATASVCYGIGEGTSPTPAAASSNRVSSSISVSAVRPSK